MSKLHAETSKAIYAYAQRRNWILNADMPFHIGTGEDGRLWIRYYWDEHKDPRPDDSYVTIGKVVDEYTRNKLIKNKKNYYS